MEFLETTFIFHRRYFGVFDKTARYFVPVWDIVLLFRFSGDCFSCRQMAYVWRPRSRLGFHNDYNIICWGNSIVLHGHTRAVFGKVLYGRKAQTGVYY